MEEIYDTERTKDEIKTITKTINSYEGPSETKQNKDAQKERTKEHGTAEEESPRQKKEREKPQGHCEKGQYLDQNWTKKTKRRRNTKHNSRRRRKRNPQRREKESKKTST